METVSEAVWSHIEEWMRNGRGPLDPDHGTLEIMAAHPDISGTDVEFYIPPTRDGVRDEYHRQAKRFKAQPLLDPDPQLVLEGFARLQKAYLVDRAFETEVAFDDLSTDEKDRVLNAAREPLKQNGKMFIVMRPKPLLIKIEDLTDDELDQKEQEYRDMASGCIEHANELARYKSARRGAA